MQFKQSAFLCLHFPQHMYTSTSLQWSWSQHKLIFNIGAIYSQNNFIIKRNWIILLTIILIFFFLIKSFQIFKFLYSFGSKITFYAFLNWKGIQFSESLRFAWIREFNPKSIIIMCLQLNPRYFQNMQIAGNTLQSFFYAMQCCKNLCCEKPFR